MCERVFLLKAGYVNHLKAHENNQKKANDASLSPHPGNNSCVVCKKTCKSASGLKRHMLVHKKAIKHPDSINPVKATEFICHMSLMPMKFKAGFKSHLRGHERRNEIGDVEK